MTPAPKAGALETAEARTLSWKLPPGRLVVPGREPGPPGELPPEKVRLPEPLAPDMDPGTESAAAPNPPLGAETVAWTPLLRGMGSDGTDGKDEAFRLSEPPVAWLEPTRERILDFSLSPAISETTALILAASGTFLLVP